VRKKDTHSTTRVPPVSGTTSTNGVAAPVGSSASADDVIAYIDLLAVTGSVVFKLQMSPNSGTDWFDVAEAIGDTGSLTTAGKYRIFARAPIGSYLGLKYTITTGPISFTVQYEFSNTGAIGV